MSAGNTIETNCAVIILAAGASSRLGRPKQLLPFRGKSLLQNAADTAFYSKAKPVIIVLGSNAGEMAIDTREEKVHIVENHEWKEGLGSSIRCGMQTLKRVALLSDAVILMTCDQPYITAEHLDELVSTQKETGQPIVASEYGNAVGTPALFFKTVFPQLLELNGDRGARVLIEKSPGAVATIPFNLGEIDIDTEEDFRKLK